MRRGRPLRRPRPLQYETQVDSSCLRGETIDIAALLTWVITAGFGASLFVTWLARGGLAQQARGRWLTVRLPPPYFPAPLVFSHIALAAGGLVVWIFHLLFHSLVAARIALVMLLPVAAFGFSMFTRWLGSRRLRMVPLVPLDPHPSSGPDPGPPRTRPRRQMLAESRLPVLVVICHGVFGATTIVLVLAAATGIR
jgi:manganese efflux pump family protein